MANRTVMAFGSFDILHPGHIHYLRKAASLGDRLIVIVARDSSIMMLKGRAPAFRERDRLKLISSLRFVDKALLGNRIRKREDLYRIIRQQRPNVIAFGYDQKANIPELKRWLARNRIRSKVVRITGALNPRLYKSSRLRRILFQD